MALFGRTLSLRFYRQVVRPRIMPIRDAAPHAAALLGDGSEVLGFDDSVSTDHDFGPRLQLFLPPGVDATPIHAALDDLPDEFDGFPVRYPDADRYGGHVRHQVEVTTAEAFFAARLGVDPADGMSLSDWLLTPTQTLASLTDGVVFADPAGLLADRRARLRWYPADVWRYVLAAGWLRLGQEEPFVGRTGAAGDQLGCALVTARLARELVRLTFLVERRWAPYTKWLGRAFGHLPLASAVGPHLSAALTATGWRDWEAALGAAASALGAATNRLGLADPVEPTVRQFHNRDIRVLGAERFTAALVDAVTDPAVGSLIGRLGSRTDGAYSLPGAIDQVVDSVDVLTQVDRCRAAAPILGLEPIR